MAARNQERGGAHYHQWSIHEISLLGFWFGLQLAAPPID
jgi:hypothetical protein